MPLTRTVTNNADSSSPERKLKVFSCLFSSDPWFFVDLYKIEFRYKYPSQEQ